MSADASKPKKPKRRILSQEDVELWSFVARSIGPTKGKSRVRDVEPAEQPPPAIPPAERPASNAPPASAAKARPVPSVPPPPAPRPAPPKAGIRMPTEAKAVPLERRKARRIARGTEEIEARIDLHGLTQDEAHWALIGFVRRCQAAGMRTVLVITGKGAPSGRHDHHDDVHGRPRGVLRRNVPRWLGGPEIGALVISYSTAHIRHGGEGALYVRLRRKG